MTMTNGMNCDVFTDRLMAYLEHETDDATRAAIERHSVTCVDCGALLADLRKLRIDAANLPELAPSRDLWAGVAERIEAPVVSIRTARRMPDIRIASMGRWTRRALIAASLVGAAGVGYMAAARRATTSSPATSPTQVAQAPAAPSLVPDSSPSASTSAPTVSKPESTPASTSVASATPDATSRTPRPNAQFVVASLSADYDREISRLHTLIEQRRNQLDPVTVAIIEKNLQVIDGAIAECKKAIARDPSSRFLIESLNQSFQTKVELMRTAALLPSRT